MAQAEIEGVSFLKLLSSPPGVYIHHQLCSTKENDPRTCEKCLSGYYNATEPANPFKAILISLGYEQIQGEIRQIEMRDVFRIQYNPEEILGLFRKLAEWVSDCEYYQYENTNGRFIIFPPTLFEVKLILDLLITEFADDYQQHLKSIDDTLNA